MAVLPSLGLQPNSDAQVWAKERKGKMVLDERHQGFSLCLSQYSSLKDSYHTSAIGVDGNQAAFQWRIVCDLLTVTKD
ncbi:hypothetical protein STEG23_007183 [Scotinomys teguina]